MSTGIYVKNVLIENIFGTKSSSTATATGIKSNGTDLNQILLALADGQQGQASNVKSNSKDMNSFFGIPLTTLPINGNTYGIGYTIPNGASASTRIQFSVSTSGWSIQGTTPNGTGNPNTGSGAPFSGSNPAGSTSVRFTFGASYVPTGDVDSGGTTSNPASSATAITSSALVAYYNTATWSAQSGSRGRGYAFKIEFLNSSGAVISTTNINMQAETDGSV